MLQQKFKVLHIEPTDVCQAACPACAREIDVNFNKKIHHNLDVKKIKELLTKEDICNLDKMFMCGNYGDPAAGAYSIDIYRYFRKVNPVITLGMNTNGGVQNEHWWKMLARIMNKPFDYVVFSIDGLQDTNHIYRKNVVWDRVMDNAQSFINAGGPAHWDMLVYKHNEHQVDSCERLAKTMGFKWFRAKISKRRLVSNLEYPVHWKQPIVPSNKIICFALNESSRYLDAQGNLSPCCWLGARQNNFIKDIEEVSTTWNTENPNQVCKNTCGSLNSATSFTAQWQRETKLC